MRDAKLVAQRLEQVDDRHAQRGIDHRHRLVGDDQLRLGQQRPRDGRALQLPAGQLMWIAAGDLRQRQPDLAQRGIGARLCLPLIAGLAEAARRQEQVVVELRAVD